MSYIGEIVHITQTKTIGYQCDVCAQRIIVDMPSSWYSFDHSHNDWGNDSFESTESFQVCSIRCFSDQLKICLKTMKDHRYTAKIAEMNYDFAEALYNKIK